MEYLKGRITKLLVDYFESDFRRITHALEVLRHAEAIAEGRGDFDAEVLIAAALLHDIGIKSSEALHGYNNGKTQVDARFTPPVEKLAFPIRNPGELDLPEIWPEPLPLVVQVLKSCRDYREVADNLPDIEIHGRAVQLGQG